MLTLGQGDLEDEVSIFNGPRRTTNKGVVEVVLLGLLNEQLPSLTLQRRDASILNCFGAGPEAGEEFFYVDLGQGVLLIIRPPG
jgi:hypothetical protein